MDCQSKNYKMNTQVIEDVQADGSSEWNLSFTDSNPEAKDCFQMIDSQTAFRLKDYLGNSPEQFSEVHHKIISGLGTLFSNLGANSGIMAIIMSWGDTQNSQDTLQMLNDYIEKYIEVKK